MAPAEENCVYIRACSTSGLVGKAINNLLGMDRPRGHLRAALLRGAPQPPHPRHHPPSEALDHVQGHLAVDQIV